MSGKVCPVKPVNYTSWLAVVTPTDRPKSVRNRYVSNFLWRCLCCHFALFDISAGVGVFVIGLIESDLFLFLLSKNIYEVYVFSGSNVKCRVEQYGSM